MDSQGRFLAEMTAEMTGRIGSNIQSRKARQERTFFEKEKSKCIGTLIILFCLRNKKWFNKLPQDVVSTS